MSEPLTYGGGCPHRLPAQSPVRREMLFTCVHQNRRSARAIEQKSPLLRCMNPCWRKTKLPKKHTNCPVSRDERTRAGVLIDFR
jgi:hypothetical protein